MLALLLSAALLTQDAPTALHWRNIGPFRGGRTVAVSGVPQLPGTYYMAPTDGGVWKSTDYARTWKPIFDGQDTGSIGALAVAPGDPNVIYAGSGEGLRRPDLSVGDGVYKSTDAGKTWTHSGLRDGQQINGLAVDPRDPNRVFAAVMGHPYGPSKERGLYRSTDGGATWTCVLCKNDGNTGAATVVIDRRNPDIVYADLWASRNPPWRLDDVLQLWQDGGVYKSTDGGTTWTQLHGGLPAKLGRVGIAVAPSDDSRMYAWVNTDTNCGIYRSGDAGSSWTKMDGEDRICGRGDDFSGIAVDPANPDIVYVANTTTYRSTNAGKSWTGIKGAPGGDDYHSIWIDPNNRNVILLGVDQGATLSVNYGETWSTWYNQPTAQFYHVITDNRFPYWVFGGQQESGSAEVSSRSEDGEIWIRYWHPVGAEEYAYIAPDPLHPHIIYGAGAGHVTRYDELTQQVQTVSPAFGGRFDASGYRYNRTNPLVFNRVDKRTLYLGSSVVFATRDGGNHWSVISPDLTRKHPGVPANLGAFKSSPLAKEQRGVVYSIGPSYIDRNVIWAGTDDGLVWFTRDGGRHWNDVTPPGIGAWNKITQIDPSHFDRNTAYVSVSRWRLDDLRPYIYRTHDAGKHWQLVTGDLPDDAPVNTVREDPVRRGLLFAGTERTVYLSFDEGDHWRSLQLDLPSTSIRDLVIHDNDIVVATHGRSFWILDDITPLRDLRFDASGVAAHVRRENAFLFKPEVAYRLRRDTWTDTPLPPEEPAGENPPDGAVIDYYLPKDARGPVTLSIYDGAGSLVRRFSSADKPAPINAEITVPTYWVRPTRIPGAQAGLNRFLWDYRYPQPKALGYDYPISAIYHDTPPAPEGVMALPGSYTVKLTADGRTYSEPLKLEMDPRVPVSGAALREQFTLAQKIAGLMAQTANKRLARYNAQLDAIIRCNRRCGRCTDRLGSGSGPQHRVQTARA